jgi:hypothetical protein
MSGHCALVCSIFLLITSLGGVQQKMSGPDKDLTDKLVNRRGLVGGTEADDDDTTQELDAIGAKEDKTTLSQKRLKEDDEKANKLGNTVFEHAKKKFGSADTGDDNSLRDDSEWND